MAENSGFFNSQEVDGSQDRIYYSEDFANLFTHFISNGVYAQASDQLKVVANDSPNMLVYIKPGFGFINGYWYINDDKKEISIDANTTSATQYAAIIMRLDNNARSITTYVKQKLTSVPNKTNLQRDSVAHELLLAYVIIKAGQTTVKDSNIYDTRPDNDVCGMIVNPIEHLDTSEIYSQFKSQADEQINDFDEKSSQKLLELQNAINSIFAGTDTMLKSQYDSNNNGIVDNSELLDGKSSDNYKSTLVSMDEKDGVRISYLLLPSNMVIIFVHTLMNWDDPDFQPGNRYQVAISMPFKINVFSMAHEYETLWTGDAAQVFAAGFCKTEVVEFEGKTRITQRIEKGEGIDESEFGQPKFSNIIIGVIQ